MDLEVILDLEQINEDFKSMSVAERILWANEKFGDKLVLTTSGGETSVVLPHLVKDAFAKNSIPENYLPHIIFVDTKYHNQGTYEMVSKIMEMCFNVVTYGPSLSKDDIEKRYPGWQDPKSKYFEQIVEVIKLEPFRRALTELNAAAFMSGIMRWETLQRLNAPFMEYKNGIYRIHPICDWSREQVTGYIKVNELPINNNHFDVTKGPDQSMECGIHTK